MVCTTLLLIQMESNFAYRVCYLFLDLFFDGEFLGSPFNRRKDGL